MARAYSRIGWLQTTMSETDGATYDRVGEAMFDLPWGTPSPLHLERGLDYLVRWDQEEQRWEILARSSGNAT